MRCLRVVINGAVFGQIVGVRATRMKQTKIGAVVTLSPLTNAALLVIALVEGVVSVAPFNTGVVVAVVPVRKFPV